MSFDVKESWESKLSSESPDGVHGSANFDRYFTVTSDEPSSTLLVKMLAPIPKQGNTHPDNSFFRVIQIEIEQVSPIYFKVVCKYNTKSEEGENPLDQPPDITFDSVTTTEEIDEDVHGNPIQTVNGEPITGVTEEIHDLTMSISRNLASFNPFSQYVYLKKVNSDNYFGFPPGVAKIKKISASNVFTDDYEYWAVNVQFQFREPIRTTAQKAWWKRVKHQGFYVKNDNDEIVHAVDENGENVTSPVNLKLDGKEETDKEKAHWLEFETLNKISFASLNLL